MSIRVLSLKVFIRVLVVSTKYVFRKLNISLITLWRICLENAEANRIGLRATGGAIEII